MFLTSSVWSWGLLRWRKPLSCGRSKSRGRTGGGGRSGSGAGSTSILLRERGGGKGLHPQRAAGACPPSIAANAGLAGRRGERAATPRPALPRPHPPPLLFVLLGRSCTFRLGGSPPRRRLLSACPPHPETRSLSSPSPPPCSGAPTLSAHSRAAGWSERHSTPSNRGLRVTSYFIQLEGIKAIKSKRSRQAPVKLSARGPLPFSSLLFSSLQKPPLFACSLAASFSFTHCSVRKS